MICDLISPQIDFIFIANANTISINVCETDNEIDWI